MALSDEQKTHIEQVVTLLKSGELSWYDVDMDDMSDDKQAYFDQLHAVWQDEAIRGPAFLAMVNKG